MEYNYQKQLDISQSEIDRIVDLIRWYTTYASLTRNVDTDSLTGFIGTLQNELNKKNN